MRRAAPAFATLALASLALAGGGPSRATAAAPVPPAAPPARSAPAAQDSLVEAVLARLDVRAKAAQMVMPWLAGGAAPGSAAYRRVERLVADDGVGGVIVGRGDGAATAAALRALQRRAAVPLLAAADLEWGAGMRLDGATLLPTAMAVAATGDTTLAHAHGVATAREARAAGLHAAFAPVLDVNVNPRNPIINTRSFGERPATVAAFGAATVRGLHDGGLLAVGKHFPGHGDTDQDSHVTLPAVGASRARLDSVELPPFRAAIAAGLDGVMVAHLAVPALAGDATTPASLSPAVVTGLLREAMGFEGVVFTDALNMAGATRLGGSGALALRAVRAGADVLLQPVEPRAAIDVLAAAVRRGDLAESRLDASVRRILRAKARAGLLGGPAPARGASGVAALPPARVADTIAARALTLVRDSAAALPLARAAGAPAVLSLVYSGVRVEGGANAAFEATLREHGVRTTRRALGARSAGALADSLLRAWERDGAPSVVLLASYSQAVPWQRRVGLPDAVAAAAERLARRAPVVHVAFGDPYVAASVPSAQAVLLAWSGVPAVQRAAARALAGAAPIGGRLPVSLPPRHAVGDGLDRAAR